MSHAWHWAIKVGSLPWLWVSQLPYIYLWDGHQAADIKGIEKVCLGLRSSLKMLLFRQAYNLSTEQDAKNIFEEFDEVFNRPESIVDKTQHTDTDPVMLPNVQTSHIVQSH